MDEEFFEQMLTDLKRKGDSEKVNFLENLNKKVLPSQLKKIQENDKSVYKELFMPKWMNWELLFAWASRYKLPERGKTCALCDEKSEHGIDFKNKFICENCFLNIKNVK